MYKLDRAALVPLRTCTRDTAVSISYLAEVSGLPNSLAVDSSAGLQFFTKIFTDVPENYNIMPTVFISSATRHFFFTNSDTFVCVYKFQFRLSSFTHF